MEETEALLLAVESRIEHYHQQDSTQQFPSQIQANFVQARGYGYSTRGRGFQSRGRGHSGHGGGRSNYGTPQFAHQ